MLVGERFMYCAKCIYMLLPVYIVGPGFIRWSSSLPRCVTSRAASLSGPGFSPRGFELKLNKKTALSCAQRQLLLLILSQIYQQ